MWLVEFNETAETNFLRLDKPVRERILKFFRERVSQHPDPKLLAETLSGPTVGYGAFASEITALCATYKMTSLSCLSLKWDTGERFTANAT